MNHCWRAQNAIIVPKYHLTMITHHLIIQPGIEPVSHVIGFQLEYYTKIALGITQACLVLFIWRAHGLWTKTAHFSPFASIQRLFYAPNRNAFAIKIGIEWYGWAVPLAKKYVFFIKKKPDIYSHKRSLQLYKNKCTSIIIIVPRLQYIILINKLITDEILMKR